MNVTYFPVTKEASEATERYDSRLAEVTEFMGRWEGVIIEIRKWEVKKDKVRVIMRRRWLRLFIPYQLKNGHILNPIKISHRISYNLQIDFLWNGPRKNMKEALQSF